jgi:hypothetical protein
MAEQNFEQLQKDITEIKADVKKIKHYILMGRIMSLVYLIIFIAPVILSIIFLPQIVQYFTQHYLNNALGQNSNININEILNTYKGLIK